MLDQKWFPFRLIDQDNEEMYPFAAKRDYQRYSFVTFNVKSSEKGKFYFVPLRRSKKEEAYRMGKKIFDFHVELLFLLSLSRGQCPVVFVYTDSTICKCFTTAFDNCLPLFLRVDFTIGKPWHEKYPHCITVEITERSPPTLICATICGNKRSVHRDVEGTMLDGRLWEEK